MSKKTILGKNAVIWIASIIMVLLAVCLPISSTGVQAATTESGAATTGSGANTVEEECAWFYWDADPETGVSGWYKYAEATNPDSVKMDGYPVPAPYSFITIKTAPDEELENWLSNLDGNLQWIVTNFWNGSVVVGNASNANSLTLDCLNAYKGEVTCYGNAKTLRIGADKVKVTGNVRNIYVGGQYFCEGGQVVINGNVDGMHFYKESKTSDKQTYGFNGDIAVLGTVANANIYSYEYDSGLQLEAWSKKYTVSNCGEGLFKVTRGVFDSNVPLVEYVPDTEAEYRYQYQCSRYPEDDKTHWVKQIYDKNTNECIRMDDCTIEDVTGDATIIVYSVGADEPVVLGFDCDDLTLYLEGNSDEVGKVTVYGDVKQLRIMGYREAWDLTVDGDVQLLNMNYYYNVNHNLKVSGTVGFGSVYNNATNKYIGCFRDGTVKEYLKNGNWNKNLFMNTGAGTSNTPSFNLVSEAEKKEAMSSEGIGEETEVNGKTLVKDAEISVTGVSSIPDVDGSMINRFITDENDKLDEESVLVSEINIDISTFYKDKTTNKMSSTEGYGQETVSEVDNDLEFTLLLPDSIYEDGANYTVVRQHINADRTMSIDVLETQQNGQKISFASDKFSTFMILKSDAKETDLEALLENSQSNIVYQSLLLDGTIGVKYCINLPDVLVNTDTAYIKINDSKYPISEAKKVTDGYVFVYYVNAKEMYDDIAISLYYDDDNRLSFNNETAVDGMCHCSVKSYLDQTKKSSDAKMAKLAKAMDVYGQYSQKYFNYNTQLVSTFEAVNEYNLSGFAETDNGNMPEGLTYYGSSLMLKSETSIRHYYHVNSGYDIEDYVFEVNGQTLTPTCRTGLYYIEIPNIAAAMLGNNAVTKISKGENIYEYNYSALSYMNKCKTKYTAAEDIYKLANAMASYYDAAKSYFESLDEDETQIQ